MKTLLVLTDFSVRAEHAAHYALKLAQKIKADILLCNVYIEPSGDATAAQIGWPAESTQNFEEDNVTELKNLAARLTRQLNNDAADGKFRPMIEYCCKEGEIADCINEVVSARHILMAIISMHGANGISTLLLGDHARKIIENANCPVLVVPYQIPFKGFKKIAFASDLSETGIDVLQSLSGLAKYSDSEILITHVADEKEADKEHQHVIRHFFDQVSSKVNYPKIYYRAIKNRSVINGLDWLAENTDIDMLVLVHRKRNFFQKIFEGSVTQKLAGQLTKPMLVFPCSGVLETLPVF